MLISIIGGTKDDTAPQVENHCLILKGVRCTVNLVVDKKVVIMVVP